VACIDHHVSQGSLPGGPRLVAPEAAATAELVFDLASALGWSICPEAARALYVGLLTDTGAFRFANTSPRALRVAGALLERGVSPESIYESVYASAPEGRVRLMTEVLQTLVVEPDVGLAWVTVPPDALQRHGATAVPAGGLGHPHRHRLDCERHPIGDADRSGRAAAEGFDPKVGLLHGERGPSPQRVRPDRHAHVHRHLTRLPRQRQLGHEAKP